MYRYSRRLAWDGQLNSITRLVTEKRANGERLIDLTVSNPTQVVPAYPHEAIRRAYGELPDFLYEPDPLGYPAARDAIAGYYRKRHIEVCADRLLVTASTSEAYSLLFKLFCDPDDEVLVPVPSYPLFEYLAGAECVHTIPYRLAYDGDWYIDFDDLESRISPRTRAIVVVNPNNPTGSYLKRPESVRLLETAAERKLVCISDEVFCDYPLDRTEDSVDSLIGSDIALSFSMSGLSKAAGMPQMKLGWIAINGPEGDWTRARSRLELLSDSFLSVGTPVQRALPALLEIGTGIRQALQARIRTNLDWIVSALADTAGSVLPVGGGWSAIIQLPQIQSEESWVISLLDEENVLVQPGYFFDMASEAYVVISLITTPELFQEGVEGLKILLTRC